MKVDKDKIQTCGYTVIHQDVVNGVSKRMLEEETITSLAEFFKVFGDPTFKDSICSFHFGNVRM